MDNTPTLITAAVSIFGAAAGAIKAWGIIKNRISSIEFKQSNIVVQVNDFVEKTEKFMEESEESREQVLESVYKLTTTVKGIDGNNGLVGRSRETERRLLDVEKEVAEGNGRYQMWESLNNNTEK